MLAVDPKRAKLVMDRLLPRQIGPRELDPPRRKTEVTDSEFITNIPPLLHPLPNEAVPRIDTIPQLPAAFADIALPQNNVDRTDKQLPMARLPSTEERPLIDVVETSVTTAAPNKESELPSLTELVSEILLP